MTEFFLLGPVVLLLAGGVLCAAASGTPRLSNHLGAAVTLLGGLPAASAAIWTLLTGEELSIRIPWSVPFGSLSLSMDGLSAFFVLVIAVVSILGAIYGCAYMDASAGKGRLGVFWLFYNVLVSAMILVVTARNGVLFLMAWEAMSLSSFFLVMFEHEKHEVREAGWRYLIAMHLGTAFLLAEFVLLAGSAESWDFALFESPSSPARASALFLLAVVGFGTKAGFLPLHVWLPEAHPAAPSHVSAVMSGIMIKTGIYGLMRTLTFLGPPQAWWGFMLLFVGAASGVAGVLMALAQHDLKRLLAYHSVENIGIICLGIGLGVLGTATGNASLAMLGIAGGLLHVWNHAVFKSLLFLGTGAVVKATGTRDIERMGGLLKRMPLTAGTFLIASAAICGLPPLNGFVSEWLIYFSAYAGVARAMDSIAVAVGGVVAITALVSIGGLAVACFTKAFGVVFLGEPRSPEAATAADAPAAMKFVMASFAGLCVLLGLLGPVALAGSWPAARNILPPALWAESLSCIESAMGWLWRVSLFGGLLLFLSSVLLLLRVWILSSRGIRSGTTWDCGYAAPNARMQYTASSYAAPITCLFRWFLRPRIHMLRPTGFFPDNASFESQAEDLFLQCGYRPVFGAMVRLAGVLQRLQQGCNQLYILYIALTLLVLLVWKLG